MKKNCNCGGACSCEQNKRAKWENANEAVTYDDLEYLNTSDPKGVNSTPKANEMLTMWSVPQWEYKVQNQRETSASMLQERLNLEGEGGWELVSMSNAGHVDGFCLVFKRQKTYIINPHIDAIY